ncbi:MAG: 23S rRNA (uracil(1939)-C(5))-methyltransferase RlmD [Coriobacteriales bacterium]|nr:23S rRNA (uracil(1939)-C(5))-methyltransferase RlmD [Coriobacteriales bacterium]
MGNLQEFRIESLAYQGAGVAHHASGKTVFVPGTVPGDRVQARIVRTDKRYDTAELLGVLEPAAVRRRPPCVHAASCGGCGWQVIERDAQLLYKRRFVVDALQHIGGFSDAEQLVAPQICHGREWGYRNKIELAADYSADTLRLSMHASGDNAPTPVNKCLLLPSALENAPRILASTLGFALKKTDSPLRRVGIRVSRHTGDVEVAIWTHPSACNRNFVAKVMDDALKTSSLVRVLVADAPAKRKIRGVEVLSGKGFWAERLGDFDYRISAPSFFQVNSGLAGELIADVLRMLQPQGKHVFDLYSGAGTFTLPLAAAGAQVQAVEMEGSSIRDLRRNLEINGLKARVHGGDMAHMLPQLGSADAAIIDPPRSGLSKIAMQALLAAKIAQIIYVSCNPATLARDLAALRSVGYELREVLSYDLFPQTYHVETVAWIEKVGNAQESQGRHPAGRP